MSREMLMDLIRTGMKVLGGFMLAKLGRYGVDQAGWDTLTGGALVLGSFVWSIVSTYHFTK